MCLGETHRLTFLFFYVLCDIVANNQVNVKIYGFYTFFTTFWLQRKQVFTSVTACNPLDSVSLWIFVANQDQKKKKNFKLYGPFLWIGFNCLKARATLRRQFPFYHWVPRSPWKDEWLSQSWSHPVVLSTRPLDCESSVLTKFIGLFYMDKCHIEHTSYAHL